MATTLDSAAVRSLRDLVRGDPIMPDQPGYDAARAVWNGRVDPRPLAVVPCRDVDEVAATVRFARDHGVPLSVRGGGHSYAGFAVGAGALALDLSPMDAVLVDPAARVATVGPGATWVGVDRETQRHGLATTGATVSTVGVAGYMVDRLMAGELTFRTLITDPGVRVDRGLDTDLFMDDRLQDSTGSIRDWLDVDA